jgi:hypothetical protein
MANHGSGAGNRGRDVAAVSLDRGGQMEITRLSVPAASVQVEIDEPLDHWIAKPSGAIGGWFATRGGELPEEFYFRMGPVTLPHAIVRRQDVEEAMPEYRILAFQIPFDLFEYLPYVQDHRLVIQLVVAECSPVSLRFRVRESALASCISRAG